MNPNARHPAWPLLLLIVVIGLEFCVSRSTAMAAARRVFSAGASAVDITPTGFPVVVNAMFTQRTATRANDPLHARGLVLDDGSTRLALCVVDTCMMPRDLIDRAKELARERTGIPTGRILVSATHTHSAPSAMGCLGSDVDANYAKFLPGKIAEAIERAAQNLAPARVGWAVVQDYEHTHCRRWIRRPDKLLTDPFGERNVRANMHPGHQNPDAIGPSGPVDPDLSVLSVQSPAGHPIALLANYSMHYYESPLLSADYYGLFAYHISNLVAADVRGAPSSVTQPSRLPKLPSGGQATLNPQPGKESLAASATAPSFVGIMSQGTSGDQMWMDYGEPQKKIGLDAYAREVAQAAFTAYKKINYREWVPLVMCESKLTLGVRLCDQERLEWAKKIVADLNGRLPQSLPEIYAREQLFLHERPRAELKLQAIRIGDLGITAIPNEVFGITGLKLKAQSPLIPTFNIELANGSEGYIPPPEQHALGGYTTWAARTAGLETDAEPKIVAEVLRLLEQVSGKPRRQSVDTHGPYARAVLASKPAAYFRLDEFAGPSTASTAGRRFPGVFEGGVAFGLEGPQSPAFSGLGAINRAPHFAGGRLQSNLKLPGERYSIELWFWNGLPNDARDVTGFLWSQGRNADQLWLGGTTGAPGRLVFSNGRKLNGALTGRTVIELKTWNHVVLTRDGRRVALYLNGSVTPDLEGDLRLSAPEDREALLLASSHDHSARFEGKLDEVAIYGVALTAKTAARHYRLAGMLPGRPQR